MHNRRQRQLTAPHRRPRPAARGEVVDQASRRVDVTIVHPKEQLQAGIAERVRQYLAGRLGGGATRSEVLQEALDAAQPLISRPIEAPVHGHLKPRAEWPEGQRHRERRRRGRYRGPTADRHAQRQRDGGEGGGEPRGQRCVDQRAVDQPIDLVQPVAHHRDRNRGRDRDQRKHDRGSGGLAVVPGDGDLDEADADRAGDQNRGIDEPSQLQALDAGGPPQPAPHGDDAGDQRRQRTGPTDGEPPCSARTRPRARSGSARGRSRAGSSRSGCWNDESPARGPPPPRRTSRPASRPRSARRSRQSRSELRARLRMPRPQPSRARLPMA